MRLKPVVLHLSDKNFDGDLGLGFIPVDSVHSPVRKVITSLKQLVSVRITDRQLTIEIWTNETVLPAELLDFRRSC